MELVLLGVFALIFAMLFNWGAPRVMAHPRLATLQTSYAGKTLVTGAIVFVFLIAVSYAMSAVGERPRLPAV